MVTFSHHDRSTSTNAWSAQGRDDLPPLPSTLPLGPGNPVLLVAAHPDDETLGAGGLIRQALAAGSDVHVLMCSSGEASHPDSPTHTPEYLAKLRQQELAAALGVLTVDTPTAGTLSWDFLGLPDGKLRTAREQIRDAVEQHISAQTGLIVSTYRHDGHTDHEVLGEIAAELAATHEVALLEFPLWYWHWADPSTDQRWRHWHRLPLDPEDQVTKQAAAAEHRSQVAPLSEKAGDERLLGADFVAHFELPYEVFRYTPVGMKDSGAATSVFDALYRRHRDPWNYVDSPYEQRKRLITMASLQRQHYGSVLELGCSIGISTAELAHRSGQLIGVDASPAALEQARKNTADFDHVTLVQATVPQDWPELPPASHDLVVISEIGYYLAADELHQLLQLVTKALRPGGELLLCHWLHQVEGWSLTGTEVHDIAQGLGWPTLVEHRERDFRLEIYQRPDTESDAP